MRYLWGIKSVTKNIRIRNHTIRNELEVVTIFDSLEKQQLSGSDTCWGWERKDKQRKYGRLRSYSEEQEVNHRKPRNV